jgi:excisionase family DNA binding protein
MSKRKIHFYTLDELGMAVTISVEEASHLLGICRTAAYEGAKRGEVPVVRVGGSVRVLAKPLYDILMGLELQSGNQS